MEKVYQEKWDQKHDRSTNSLLSHEVLEMNTYFKQNTLIYKQTAVLVLSVAEELQILKTMDC